MNLTVLGNYGPYPPVDGACSSYLVETERAKLLLDIGSGSLSRLQRYIAPEALDGIVLSHLHYDHISDIFPLKFYLEIKKASINLYMEKSDSPLYKLISSFNEFNVIDVACGQEVRIKDSKLTFFAMNHSVSDLAVKIEADKTLAYTGDTMFCENIFNLSRGADLTLADCSQRAGIKSPHMTVDQAKLLRSGIDGRLMITHLHPDYNPKAYFEGERGVEISEQLTTYSI